MANSKAGTSSDAARALGVEYDVFLNFRGEDTRYVFTDFLYHGLIDAGVHVFRDEDGLSEGEVIGDNLVEAINNSKLYIPIFSLTYASSKWCLRELKLMTENVSESEGRKSILPIFLDVEPEDLKLKTPLYTAAFEKHKKNFPNEVEAWKRALGAVDEIKGWNVKKDEGQAMIVKEVVWKVLEELKIRKKSVPKDLLGHDDRVDYLTELLDTKQLDVRLIQIYGMVGMGKTTIAKVVFNNLCSYFRKYCSFVEDIRETLTKEGIVQLQKKLLSDIDGSRSVEKIHDKEEGMRRIEATLGNKKVLVVLDDVDEKVPIKNLIGNSKLHQGSRIIITTRDEDILSVEGFEGKIYRYEMLQMDDTHALQLFCRHAFGRDFPSDDCRERSRKILSLMEGLPLAIEVVGSLLKGRKEDFWNDMLGRLREKPVKNILDKLRISYDDLEYDVKQIFLDIACFLFNEKKTDATYLWEDCKFYPAIGIDVLTKRCLIKILDNGKLWMHNQLINLGRHIVHQENPFNPGERSRLWVAEEALQIIRNKRMKDKVQAINIDGLDNSIEIENEEFRRVDNIRLLKLRNGTYAADFATSCSKLRWISWHSPHRDLRGDSMHNNLVVFKLHDTSFTDDAKAWDLIKMAQNLKVLSLTQCNSITTIPDFSNCSSLERLTLAHCEKLKRIESFIKDLESLIQLEIEWCEGLLYLPEEMGALVRLERLSLRGCSGLSELPCSLGNLTSLTELDLSKTGIAKLPNSMSGLLKLESSLLTDKTMMEFPTFIEKLRSLRILSSPKNGSYSPKHHVWQLPSGISILEVLEKLDLSGCDELTGENPVGIAELSCFGMLNLTSTQICGIPRNIDVLHHLEELNLRRHHEIQELRELPSGTNNMLHQHASSPPELPSLSRLDLKTDQKRSSSLLRLDLLCSSFMWADFPSSLISRNLTTLELYYAEVEDIPLDRLSGLESLTVHGCEQLQRLDISSENFRQAHLSYCPDLVDISVSYSEKMESFIVFGCKSLERIKFSGSVKMEKLDIRECNELTDVCGLERLESLKSLEVTQCPSLQWLIDASCTNIPGVCITKIKEWQNSIEPTIDPSKISLKHCIDKIPRDTSNFESESEETETEGGEKATARRTSKEPCCREMDKMKHPLKIKFHLGVKKYSEGLEFVGGITRENKDVNPDSVTYNGLIADLKGFGFRLKRMWYETPSEDRGLFIKIKSDEQVKGILQLASKRGSIDLYVEGEFDSEPGNTECTEAQEKGRQMKDRNYGSVNEGKTESMENRKGKDDIKEFTYQNDVGRSSCQGCEGVEHYERPCNATAEVEDKRGIPSGMKVRTMETDRVPAKRGKGSGTRRASKRGRDPAKKGSNHWRF